MVFSTPVFLFIFLPITILIYYLSPQKIRNMILLIASLLFYAWGEPKMIIILLISIILNYLFGLFINSAKKAAAKKILLAIAVLVNICILILFKYAGFIVVNINRILHISLAAPNIPLPIGISFFTFQALSYVIDVYRNDGKVQKNILSLALYISFFPQLIAGPIVRYKDIEDQIQNRHVDYKKMTEGVQRFIIGLSKKVLIANTVAYTADCIFSVDVGNWTTGMGWLAIICYTLQIYFDFSGYSDMAIGLGKMFGFEFLENFNYPYISSSIREFWRRWHISLSRWFRDYLYIPLGGSRAGKLRMYLNQLIIFILCGMWHGASWNFLIWGLLHGTFLVLERMTPGRLLGKVARPFRHVYTMLVVIIAWVFFRAESLTDSASIVMTLFGKETTGSGYNAVQYLTPLLIVVIGIGIAVSTGLPTALLNRFKHACKKRAGIAVNILTILGCISLLFLAVITLASDAYNPFIYFKF
ncbi:MAG: MBOAT family protein [Eubacteriales bacterium]|nr:MBOAT family protein [Eubacteriales bacterium]